MGVPKMPSSLVPAAHWLVNFHCIAFAVLFCVSILMRFIKQPASRLTVAWAAMLGLLFAAALTMNPNSVRVRLGWIALPTPRLSSSRDGFTARQVLVSSEDPPAIVSTVNAPTANDHRRFVPAVGTFSFVAQALLATFVFGSGGLALWLAGGWVAACRILRGSSIASASVRQMLPGIETTAGGIRLLVSNRIEQPMAIGLLRPTIVLPAWIVHQNCTQSIRAALAHELAHIRRGDLWLLAACRWLLLLLFCNPMYWWLRKQIWLDQEFLADDAVARQWDSERPLGSRCSTDFQRDDRSSSQSEFRTSRLASRIQRFPKAQCQ